MELTQMMGPAMAAMLQGGLSEAMDFELHMVKALSEQEVPMDAVQDMIRELDADKDGRVSRSDFLMTAKKALFDPNPPEEVMQAMEQAERAMMGMGGGMGASRGAGGGFLGVESTDDDI